MMGKNIIDFNNVTIGYGKKIILENINFSIIENDFWGIVGPNGAGKTTLLKSILGTLKVLKGSIHKENIRCGYVPQKDVIQPVLPYTVNDVVQMGRYAHSGVFNPLSANDNKIVDECLEKTGINHLKNKSYKNLSGGEKQRALIARALAVEPMLLILDEPTNGMDTPSHYALLNLIASLHEEKGLTIILVSHLLSDVANFVKKLILIDKNYFQVGDINEVLSEENLEKTYSSEFNVLKFNGEYIITSKPK